MESVMTHHQCAALGEVGCHVTTLCGRNKKYANGVMTGAKIIEVLRQLHHFCTSNRSSNYHQWMFSKYLKFCKMSYFIYFLEKIVSKKATVRFVTPFLTYLRFIVKFYFGVSNDQLYILNGPQLLSMLGMNTISIC